MVHTFYVDVLTTSTMYLGMVVGSTLHALVLCTSGTWDTGSLVLVLIVGSTVA